METAVENYQLPLVLGYYQNAWVYGREAKRLATINEGCTVSDLFRRAVHQEKIRVGAKTHEAIWLLAKYIQLALEQFKNIEYITFSVPYTNIDISKMLKGIGQFYRRTERTGLCTGL